MAFTFNQTMHIEDLLYAESDLGNPSFIWNGVTYPCLPSSDTQQFTLSGGGFENITTLSLTVRIYNADGSSVFAGNVIPSPQEIISYTGQDFRVETVNKNVLGVSFRIIAASDAKGI